jgi:hypothetical protein
MPALGSSGGASRPRVPLQVSGSGLLISRNRRASQLAVRDTLR